MYTHLPATHPLNNFRDIEAVGLVLYFLGKHRRAIAQTSTVDKWPNTDGIIDLINLNGDLIGKFDIQIKKLPDINNMVYDLDVEYLAYCDQTASEPTLTLLVDTVKEKIYWFHVTREWIRKSNYAKNKAKVRIQLKDEHCFDRENTAYISQWEDIIREVQRGKGLLQQLLDNERGKRAMRMNLLDANYSPILTNLQLSVFTHEKLEDGSVKFIMSNKYQTEEMVFLNVDIHLTADLKPLVKLNMSPMRQESAYNSLMYYKALSRMKNGDVFYLVDNHSDFWCTGKVNHSEDDSKIEPTAEYMKLVVDIERKIDKKLILGRDITFEEHKYIQELEAIINTGRINITFKGKASVIAPENLDDLSDQKGVFVDLPIASCEHYWGINLGRKLIISDQPFSFKKSDNDENRFDAEIDGKYEVIFIDYFEGDYSQFGTKQ
ncbi:DUF4365 domain-containing protein [Paenibacillus allorhizosphaerae]|uniref:DUF4365 domain-containing protein n=1 Tax=Paenibacillus allorhizosphaerae TaxID=2849866 RepID=A0ABN7TXF1_9BACL|nr:DUF4365 domain-containing protein [Paenibacillus allorhizosphaerae]CAG7659125.1 hypothetical protein PAECIP111802_07394 [Paenibacillus allorhizosphaerae]